VEAFSYAVPLKPPNTIFGSTGPPYAPRHGSSNFLSGDVGELKIKHHIKIIIICNQKTHAKIYGSLCGPKGEEKGAIRVHIWSFFYCCLHGNIRD